MKKDVGRKELRKQARHAKKERKKENFVKRHVVPNGSAPASATSKSLGNFDFNGSAESKKKSRRKDDEDEEINSDDDDLLPVNPRAAESKSGKISKRRRLVPDMPNEDDLEVERLEQQLGLGKKAKKGDAWKQLQKGLMQDGFDADMLDFLKDADRFLAKATKEDDTDVIDEDDSSVENANQRQSLEEAPEGSSQDDSLGENEAEKDELTKDEDIDDDDDSEFEEVKEELDPMSEEQTMFLPSSNIYGDAKVGKDEGMERLSISVDRVLDQKVRSLLNRCSQENAPKIVKDLLTAFDQHPPMQVFDSLTRTILESVTSSTCLMFASVLYSIEASRQNLISHVIETIVLSVDKKDVSPSAIMLLGSLCALQACTAGILFDIGERLKAIGAGQEESLLSLVSTSGWKMRASDPTRFRELLLDAAVICASERLEAHAKSKFDYSAEEERVRKWRKFVLRELKEGMSLPAPLNVPFQDFANAQKRGRWWVLGASWTQSSKNPIGGSEAAVVSRSSKNNPLLIAIRNASKDMLRVAHAQGMDTDLKKAVFCSIMSSDDHVHAFDNLLRLNLDDQGEREVVRIVIRVCSNCKSYNPFFAYLAAKLCSVNERYPFSFKLALWDKIKPIDAGEGESTGRKLVNLARFIADLILQSSLPLSVLKVISFAKISTKDKLHFLRELLLALLLPTEVERDDQGEGDAPNKREGDLTVAKVFARLRGSREGSTLRDGILVFWSRTEPFMHVSKSKQPSLYKRLKIAKDVMEHYVKSEDEKLDENF